MIIVYIIIDILIISMIVINKINKNDKEKINVYTGFKRKEKLMTNTEFKFYKMLKQIADKNELLIFSQVALNQIIKSDTYRELRQIGGKSIDYVITDKYTNIKICVELDDYTHNKNKRKTRDDIVNNILYKANVKLLRIPIDQAFIYERIEKQIQESL